MMMQNKRPLEGVRVVEMATFVAAPACARFLADLGATVIKVEAPGGDPYRNTAISEGRPAGDLENTSFDLDNANKSGICLDTKDPKGKEALENLICASDVFITNVRYKSLTKIGLDYEALIEKHPKLVFGYVTGYGDKGPDMDLPGFDFTAFYARGGILGTMFDREHVPMATIPGFGDHQVGLYLASGIIAALYRARATGLGDKVSVSLFHSAIWDISIMLQSAQYGSDVTRYPILRKENSNPLQVAHKTSDGRWFQFAVPAYNANYNRFVKALGREDLVDDARYFPQSNLQENLEEFYELIKEEMAKRPISEWSEAFKNADLPFAVAQTWDELLKDEQAWATDCYYSMEYPTGATRTLVRPPIMFQDTPLPEYNRGPYIGEHTEQILASLGYNEQEIKSMMEAGIAQHSAPRKG